MKTSRIPDWVIDLLLAVVYVLMAAAFLGIIGGCTGNVRSNDPPAPVLACDAKCFAPCTGTDGDTGIRWDGSPVDARMWDVLAGEVVPQLADALRECEVHRKACAQCIQRAKDAGVVK